MTAVSSNPPSGRSRRRHFTRSGIDVVTVIVALNVALFLYLDLLIDAGRATAFVNRYAVSFSSLKEGSWWQLVTHLFLHGGDGTSFSPFFRFLHLAVNMLIIHHVGKALVWELGSRHFLALYLSSGVMGGLLQVAVTPLSPLLGASGAAFGLVTAYAAIRANELLSVYVFFFPLTVSGASLTISIILSCIILGLVDLAISRWASIPFVSHVGHFAHLGGALGGLAYVRLFGKVPRMLSRDDIVKAREANERRLAQYPADPL